MDNKDTLKNLKVTPKKRFKTRMITGLIVIIPFFITLYIINFINNIFLPLVKKIGFLDKLSTQYPILENIIGITFGAIITFTFIYIAGILATNILGKRIIIIGESIINKIPIIKTVYSLSKQVIESVTISSSQAFKRVVWLDYPTKGIKALGFVTKDLIEKSTNTKYISIFMPTTPNPTSGFMMILPETEVTDSGLTIEEAMKIIISGGMFLSKEFSLSETKLNHSQ